MQPSFDCRDRTSEFFSTLAQIQKAQAAIGVGAGVGVGRGDALTDGASHRPLPKSSSSSFSSSSSSSSFANEFDDRPDGALLQHAQAPAPPPKQQSQFTQAAQHIGRSIHTVTEKLEKLGKLARQRSLFNDPASEINELTYVIKSDLSTLHNELEVLHRWVVAQKEGRASGGASGVGGGNGEVLSAHAARNSSAIVDNLKSQLMHTTKSFQEVLQVRTSNLKEQNQRRKQFEAGGGGERELSASSSSASSSASGSLGNGSVRKRGASSNPFESLMSQAASHRNGAAGAGHSPIETEATTADDFVLGDPAQLQAQSLQLAPPVQQDDYLQSRAEAVESIESTIVELGEMYKRLVHIVGMQEEITLRIDANMDSALENVDKGHHQLLTYYDSISGNRWLILKIFAVLIAFLVFFMIFVA